ncbi:MAG: TetR/AcrR family transcriptional regulator [Calditrichaeota bacterium]|nr:TetR/AcrR family transcriptional regulator [Calditrichota bacterium]
MFTKRQKDIIQSAIELIAQEGIQKLTIKNLSAKVGVTEGAIYRHFTSKLEILLGILSLFEKSTAELIGVIKKSPADPLKQLEMLFKEHFLQFKQNPAVASVIFSEELFLNERQLSEKVYEIMRNTQATIESIIQKGQEQGVFRNDIAPDQLALLLIGALRLTVTRWRLSQFSFDLKEEGDRLWDTILKVIKTN